MDEGEQIKTENDEVTQDVGNVDLMQTQYVKVATQEVALLIRAVYDYKTEREKLLAKCLSLEQIISHQAVHQGQGGVVSGPVTFCTNSGTTISNNEKDTPIDSQIITRKKKVPDQELPESKPMSMPLEQTSSNLKPSSMPLEQTSSNLKPSSIQSVPSPGNEKLKSSDNLLLVSRGSSNFELNSVELEEDCAIEEPKAVDLCREFRSMPDLARNKFAYDAASIERTLSDEKENTSGFHVDIFNSISSLTSSSSIDTVPFRHPSINEEMPDTSSVFRVGVAQHYFDCAIEELEKVKKENSFYKRTVSILEKQLLQSKRKIQELLTIVDQQKQFDQLHPYSSTQELFSNLSKKLNQQEKRINLNKMAIDQLNKQCELWREKYRQSDAENQNLSKRIASLLDEEKQYVDFGVQTETSSKRFDVAGMPHFEMLNTENPETSHDTKLLTDATYYGLDNSAYLTRHSSDLDDCNLELSTDCHNFSDKEDCCNQRYEAVQNENENLKYELNRNTERLTRLNHELFEKYKLLNAMEDTSINSSSTSEVTQFASLPSQNLPSRDSTLQKIIKLICNENSNNKTGAMSDLFFDEKEQNDRNDNVRRYNSDTAMQNNIHQSWTTNSI